MLARMCWCCFFALWVACGCGEASVDWMRDGLDVEAAGGMAEVQKEQEIVVDWTLKLRDAWQKSKRSKKPWWIGR